MLFTSIKNGNECGIYFKKIKKWKNSSDILELYLLELGKTQKKFLFVLIKQFFF